MSEERSARDQETKRAPRSGGVEPVDSMKYLSRLGFSGVQPKPSGLLQMDEILGGGLRPGLHVIGAPPGTGKTALALGLAQVLSMTPNPEIGGAYSPMYVSLEIPETEAWARLCARLSATRQGLTPFAFNEYELLGQAWRSYERGQDGKLSVITDEQNVLAMAAKVLDAECSSLRLCGTEFTYNAKLRWSFDMRRLSSLLGLIALDGFEPWYDDEKAEPHEDYETAFISSPDVLFLDHLQLVVDDMDESGDTVLESSDYSMDAIRNAGHVARMLSEYGKQHSVPVVALSQLPRTDAAKVSDGVRPSVGMFKGSSWIESEALSAWVMVPKDKTKPRGPYRRVDLYCVKSRHGAPGVVPLGFMGACGLFRPWEHLDETGEYSPA